MQEPAFLNARTNDASGIREMEEFDITNLAAPSADRWNRAFGRARCARWWKHPSLEAAEQIYFPVIPTRSEGIPIAPITCTFAHLAHDSTPFQLPRPAGHGSNKRRSLLSNPKAPENNV